MSRLLETSKLLRELNALWDEHASHVGNANKALRTLLNTTSRIPSSYLDIIKKLTDAQNALTASTSNLNTITRKQAQELQRLMNNYASVLSNNKALNKAIQDLEKRLNAANKELERLNRNTSASGAGLGNILQRIRQLEAEVARLNSRLNSANTAVIRLGNASRLSLGPLTSLMGAFGVSTGVYLFASVVKNIYQNTKELESMNLALRMVSETEEKYATNRNFLNQVSAKWGLEIKSLTQQYIQFYTASKGLLSDRAIESTFQGIAKAGAVMGLSLEKQSAAFYAIDQMMSKGTVTSEELKKQLGNAMPGAIKAAAMAYKDLHPEIKTIQEAEEALLKAMKKGAIDSATYVPLIVDNLQKLYGIENLNSIDTLISKQNKLSNNWVNMIRSMNENNDNGLKTFFSWFITAASNAVYWVDRMATSWKDLRNRAEDEGEGMGRQHFVDITEGMSKEKAIEFTKGYLDDIVKEQEKFKDKIIKLQKELAPFEGKTFYFSNPFDESVRSKRQRLEKLRNELGQLNGFIQAYNELINELINEKKVPDNKEDEEGIKNKRERIALEFDYIKAQYEAKKAVIELSKAEYAHAMNDENSTIAKRLEARVEFTRKSLELIKLEADEQKALSFEKFLDDKMRNDVAYRNKDITQQQHNKNILDLQKRLTYEQEKVDTNYSQKWQELMYENEAFSRRMYQKRLEYAKRTTKAEFDFYIKQLEDVLNSKSVSDAEFIQAAQDRREAEYNNAVKDRDEKIKLANGEADLIKAIWAEFGKDVLAIDDKLNAALEQNRERRIKRQLEIDAYNRDALGHTDVMGEFQPGYLSGASQDMIDKYNELIDNYVKAVETGDEAIIEERKRQLDEFKNYIEKINEYATGFVQDFISKSGFDTLFAVLSKQIAGFGTDWKTTFLAIAEIAQETMKFLTQNSEDYFDAERQRLEDSYDYQMSLAGENVAAQEQVEREYEERKREINRRQAKAEKENAMFNIALDTAQALIGLWVNPGFPAAIPLAIAVGALGALQMAMVASKPIPNFFVGTDNAPEGPAWTDEHGPELHMDRFGRIKDFGSTSGPRIKFLEKGDKIVPTHKTKNILSESELGQLDELLFSNNILYHDDKNNQLDDTRIIDSLRDLKNSIDNKETSEEYYDLRGHRKYSKRNGERIESKNNRIRFKKSIL